jgi:hypothetical protein
MGSNKLRLNRNTHVTNTNASIPSKFTSFPEEQKEMLFVKQSQTKMNIQETSNRVIEEQVDEQETPKNNYEWDTETSQLNDSFQ